MIVFPTAEQQLKIISKFWKYWYKFIKNFKFNEDFFGNYTFNQNRLLVIWTYGNMGMPDN